MGLGHHSVGVGVKIKVMYTYNSRSVDDTLATLLGTLSCHVSIGMVFPNFVNTYTHLTI